MSTTPQHLPPSEPEPVPAIRAVDDTPEQTQLVARSPEDLLALAPVVLGYYPRHCVVMLTFEGRHRFHAGLPLPDDLPPRHELAQVAEQAAAELLRPAERHGVRRVALMIHVDDAGLAAALADALLEGARRAGIGVVDLLHASGGRFHPLLHTDPAVREAGIAYDLRGHPFVVRAVLEGRSIRGSRSELEVSVGADDSATDPVAEQVGRLDPWPDARRVPVARLLAEGDWVERTVHDHLVRRAVPSDADLARMVHGMRLLRVRDAAWSTIRPPRVLQSVDLWTQVLRRTPAPLVPAPACLLAYAAWQSGDGALAWCALDRCAQVDPAYSLHGLLAGFLSHAVPPSSVDVDFDWRAGVR